MKRIGVLTLYYNNYNLGGLLQAYALQKFLQLSGFETEQISFDFAWHYGNGGKAKVLFKEFRNFFGLNKKKNVEDKFQIRMQKFQNFMKLIPHSERVYYEPSEFASKYDAVVVGSDQVWAGWLPEGALNGFLLNSHKMEGKRYSYAVSLGMDTLPTNMKKLYTTYLPSFENISIRERANKEMLGTVLPNKNISIDLDPTLLLADSEWSKIAKSSEYKEPYMFCYFLGKNKAYRDAASKLANRMGLRIVSIPYAKDHRSEGFDDYFGDYLDYSCGPEEFIGWISSAKVVLTDSFHAAVFSCQFKKNFIVLPRVNEAGMITMNSRITDFLDSFGLLDYYLGIDTLNELQSIGNLNFNQYDENITLLREKSRNYIMSMLNKGV